MFGNYWMRVATVSLGNGKSAVGPILITLVVSLANALPTGLTLLNCAQELVTILVMCLILGVWPPALA